MSNDHADLRETGVFVKWIPLPPMPRYCASKYGLAARLVSGLSLNRANRRRPGTSNRPHEIRCRHRRRTTAGQSPLAPTSPALLYSASPFSTSSDVEAGPGDGAGAGRSLFRGARMADIAELTRIDRARGGSRRARARAREDDRRHLRPDAAGDGRAARHAPAQLEDCARLSRRLSDLLDALEAAGRRSDRGGLPARGQLARHRPAADPASGL